MLSSLSLFVCALVCGVFLAVKEWVFDLGLALRRSCFVFIVSYIFVAMCVSFFSSFSFL